MEILQAIQITDISIDAFDTFEARLVIVSPTWAQVGRNCSATRLKV